MKIVQANYNPDVLSCLANLSNDEVFTPPNLVNDILDLLPKELWSNPEMKFLDPVSKSGVFLREIAKRLMTGLEKKIPNKQKRINHIFENQIYGIAITELTGLLSRRSVYCTKTANGNYAICETFDNEQGNILYEHMQHSWENGKCTHCGASQEVYDRGDEAESYAYNFIHNEEPATLFKNKNLKKGQEMKFDVIVGNPPYQLSDGGAAASAMPLYHKFVLQAKKLKPRYLTMIIPSRWFSGGKGLDEFRDEMLNDRRLSKIIDYLRSSDCFPGVEIKGGICYFLWDSEYNGNCDIITIRNENVSKMNRPLLENGFDTLIRFNEAVSIVHKVIKHKENSFSKIVSARKPFGFSTDFKQFKEYEVKNSVKIYANKKIGYISINQIQQNENWIKEYKVFISMAYGAGEEYPHQILNRPILGDKNSVCTETYLVIGPFSSKKHAESVVSYINTKFFRMLVLLNKPTQHATSKVYRFVPMQDFNEKWTDERLYKKYALTKDEIVFIESMIRPMDVSKDQEIE